MAAGERSIGEGSAVGSGLILLFDKGKRPDRADLLAALSDQPRISISHDPIAVERLDPVNGAALPNDGDIDWVELLADGLTFDLLGLRPGPALATPEVGYLFNVQVDREEGSEALGLYPGPHIAQGAHALPIVRTLLGIGAALVRSLGGVNAVCWPPARSAIAPKFFAKTTESWLIGGPFPALGLLGIRFDEQGALRSEGLNFFTDCELWLDPALCRDRTAATRLAVRVVQELIGFDLRESACEFATEDGTILKLEPDRPAGLLRIFPA